MAAASAGVDRPEPLLGAQPADPVARGGEALSGELVGDEAVAELGVVVVDVDRGVDQIGVVVVAVADRFLFPLVEGLLGEPEHPAGHRDGDGVVGEVKDQRVHHLGARRERSTRSRGEDLVLLLEAFGALAQLAILRLQITPRVRRGPVDGVSIPSSRSAIRNHRDRQDSDTPTFGCSSPTPATMFRTVSAHRIAGQGRRLREPAERSSYVGAVLVIGDVYLPHLPRPPAPRHAGGLARRSPRRERVMSRSNQLPQAGSTTP